MFDEANMWSMSGNRRGFIMTVDGDAGSGLDRFKKSRG